MAIITLLTDFGVQDEYVGVLKGSILSTDAEAHIVDICHGIDAQDIVAAAHMLKAAYPYFPEGTLHVAVVDPGVGTRRSIIAAQGDGHRFIGPDNGLLEPILRRCASTSIFRVENEKLFRHPVSRTFHGRDIMAPVAGHISAGLALKDVGPPVALQEIHALKGVGVKRVDARVIEGRIIGIDRFGNLMTDIHADDLTALGGDQFLIDMGDVEICGLTATYAQGKSGEPLAVMGSRNTLEIAIKGGSAARTLNKAKGAVILVKTNGP